MYNDLRITANEAYGEIDATDDPTEYADLTVTAIETVWDTGLPIDGHAATSLCDEDNCIYVRYATGHNVVSESHLKDSDGNYIIVRHPEHDSLFPVRGKSRPLTYGLGTGSMYWTANDASLDEQEAFKLFSREEMNEEVYVSEIDALDDTTVPDYVQRDEYVKLVEQYRPAAWLLHLVDLAAGKPSSERAHLRKLVSQAVERLQDAPDGEPDVWFLSDRIEYAYNETLTARAAKSRVNQYVSDGVMRVGSLIIGRRKGIDSIGDVSAHCVKCNATLTLTADKINRETMQDFTANVIRHGTNHSSAYAGKGANRVKVERGVIYPPL